MGVGDEIMASAHARYLNARTGKVIQIVDCEGRPRWDDVWRDNPCIARPGGSRGTLAHRNAGRCRPYIELKTEERYIFIPGTLPGAGQLFLSPREDDFVARRRASGRPFVVIEPNTKPTAPKNKAWGFRRYATLVAMLPQVRFVQVGPRGTRLLPGLRLIETSRFRDAVVVLACSAGYVGNEGGLHHAAAALGLDAVVIFGGFIAPSVTGYRTQTNLYVEDERYPAGCGYRQHCDHCAGAMAQIEPTIVADHVLRMWNGRQGAQGSPESSGQDQRGGLSGIDAAWGAAVGPTSVGSVEL